MTDRYLLPRRKARICRGAGWAFLIAAALSAAGIVALGFLPELTRLCDGTTCEITTGPIELLPKEVAAKVVATPAARQTFDAYLARLPVRTGLAGVGLIEDGPAIMLMLCVGLALRRFGSGAPDAMTRALPWLRRASIAAIVWALARPLSDSLLIMLLYPGTPDGPHWYLTVDAGGIATALMLAVAAYATVWALEGGLQAQRDLAEFV